MYGISYQNEMKEIQWKLCGKVQLMLKERQKLPNPQVDTELPLHYNRKYIQESDAAILKRPYFLEWECLYTIEEAVHVSF